MTELSSRHNLIRSTGFVAIPTTHPRGNQSAPQSPPTQFWKTSSIRSAVSTRAAHNRNRSASAALTVSAIPAGTVPPNFTANCSSSVCARPRNSPRASPLASPRASPRASPSARSRSAVVTMTSLAWGPSWSMTGTRSESWVSPTVRMYVTTHSRSSIPPGAANRARRSSSSGSRAVRQRHSVVRPATRRQRRRGGSGPAGSRHRGDSRASWPRWANYPQSDCDTQEFGGVGTIRPARRASMPAPPMRVCGLRRSSRRPWRRRRGRIRWFAPGPSGGAGLCRVPPAPGLRTRR